MAELVSDSGKLAERGWAILEGSSDSTLRFVYHDSLEFQSVGDRITRDPTNKKRYTNELGLLEFAPPNPVIAQIPAAAIFGDSINGYQGVIPETRIGNIQRSFEFDTYTWLQVVNGILHVELLNQFPFELEDLELAIANESNGEQVGSLTVSGVLPAGGSSADSIGLEGRRLYNRLSVTLSGKVRESASAVRINGDEALQMRFWLTPMEADSGYAQFGPQDFSKRDSLESESVNKIVEAVVKDGWGYINATNEMPARIFSTVEFLNVYDTLGNHPVSDMWLPPGSPEQPWSQLDSVDLAGYTVVMTPDNQFIHIQNDGLTEDTRVTRYQDRTQQELRSSDGIVVRYWTGKLTFTYFRGIIDSVNVDIPTMETLIDIPQGMDHINFTQDTLTINLFNETDMMMRVNFNLEGRNDQVQPPRQVIIPAERDVAPGYTQMLIPEGDRLLSVAPNKIIVTGNALCGDRFFPDNPGLVRTVTEEQGIYGDFSLNADLKFTMDEMSMFSDPARIEGGLDYPIQDVTLNINLTNSIPLSGQIYFLAGSDTSAMDTLLTAKVPRNEIVNNRVSALDTSYSVDLTPDKIDLLRPPGVLTRQLLEMYGTAGDTVWMYGSDSLVVRSTARIKYTVDFNNGKH
jgi:hypothetical protein